MNLFTTSIRFLCGCKVSETFFTTGLTCLWVFGIKILVSAAFSNEIFYWHCWWNVIYRKKHLGYFSFFSKFTISLCRISDTNKEEIFAWGTQSLYCCVSISVLKTSRKTKPSNLYLHWLLQEEEKENCLLHPRGGGVLVVGCRHKVLCLWWGNGFCTYHMLKLLSFVFSAQFIYVIISEKMAFCNGGFFSISGDSAIELYQRIFHHFHFHTVACPLLIWLSCINFLAVCKITHYQGGILLCLAAH